MRRDRNVEPTDHRSDTCEGCNRDVLSGEVDQKRRGLLLLAAQALLTVAAMDEATDSKCDVCGATKEQCDAWLKQPDGQRCCQDCRENDGFQHAVATAEKKGGK